MNTEHIIFLPDDEVIIFCFEHESKKLTVRSESGDGSFNVSKKELETLISELQSISYKMTHE